MGRIITLLTDFGLDDAYVGTMRGVILNINPHATIVDLCHQVRPQDIAAAAFLLGSSYRYFPAGTVHLAVVDPGVGSGRRAVAVETPRYLFVGPDNGVLSYVLAEEASFKAVSLTQPRYWLPRVSRTFHGRDIFAPVAAHLSLGVPLAELGEAIDELVTWPVPHPEKQADGSLRAHIIYIDRFGNLITDAKEEDLPSQQIAVEVAGHIIEGLSPSYAAGSPILALIGSTGRLEIAVREGNAAQHLGLKVGDTLILR